MNSKKRLRGATFNKVYGKWNSCITHQKITYDLGYYETEIEAHSAYCRKFKELKGFDYIYREPVFDYDSGTVKIPLNNFRGVESEKAKWALIDIDDYEKVKPYNWNSGKNFNYVRSGGGKAGTPYILLHTLITGSNYVDHINGDGLDNRKCNLRPCSHQQNMMNTKKHQNCGSKYKGVFRIPNKWRARITLNGKGIHIGVYDNEEEAGRAYDTRAKELFGGFAKLNFT